MNSLIDQLVTYTLLGHHDGHPVTHMAVYATRYQRILRYPSQQILNQLGSPICANTAATRLANEIKIDQPVCPARC